jgi:Tol biopolymer transport system component
MRRMLPWFALVGVLAFPACSDSPTDIPQDDPVLVSEIEPHHVIAFSSNRDGSDHLYLAAADGSDVVRLTAGRSPAWSWDGSSLAFARGGSREGPGGIYVLDVAEPSIRYSGPGITPSWSPHGRLALAAWDGSGFGIFSMEADGSDRRLVVGPEWAELRNPWQGDQYHASGLSTPSWSPDGTALAFHWYVHYWPASGTFVTGPDGEDPRLVAEGTQGRPAWSPDGSRIAVTTAGGIAVYDVASGAREALFPITGAYRHAQWSPDGNHVAFERFAAGIYRIHLLELSTGSVRQLIPDAPDPVLQDYEDFDVAWLPLER